MSDTKPNLPANAPLGILYSFRRCPYAMRARLACALFLPAQCLELREVILKNKPAELLAISAKATVPVLTVFEEAPSSENIIDESRDIMLWALAQSTQAFKNQYLPLHLQLEIDELIDENDGSFKWTLDRYKYSDRYEESEQYYRALGEIFLAKLEGLLTKNEYLLTAEISLADIAIFPFVRQFAHVDNAWFEQSPYPKLIRWLNTLLDSALFISIMEKYTPWQAEHEAIYFPK